MQTYQNLLLFFKLQCFNKIIYLKCFKSLLFLCFNAHKKSFTMKKASMFLIVNDFILTWTIKKPPLKQSFSVALEFLILNFYNMEFLVDSLTNNLGSKNFLTNGSVFPSILLNNNSKASLHISNIG